MSGRNKLGAKQDKDPLQQQRNTFGAEIKIMREEQIVDPPIELSQELHPIAQASKRKRTISWQEHHWSKNYCSVLEWFKQDVV